MAGYVFVDLIVGAVVIISALLAHSRGFIREILSIAGWIFALVAAFIYAPNMEPLIRDIPYLGDSISGSCELGILAAFVTVFAAALLAASTIAPLISRAVQRSILSGFDSSIGFIFGALRGVLLIVIVFLVYERFLGSIVFLPLEESRSAQIYQEIQDSVTRLIPTQIPGWSVERYENLMHSCMGQKV